MKNMKTINHIFLMAQISNPTQEDKETAAEAAIYANEQDWIENPTTHTEWVNKRMFEIQSLWYFMTRKHKHDFSVIEFFRQKRIDEMKNLQSIISHPCFVADGVNAPDNQNIII